MRNQQGWVHRGFEKPLPEALALRINRYAADGTRRSDEVRPDFVLYIQGERAQLPANIEQLHESKHYVTVLRTDVGWEKRDDGRVQSLGCVAEAVSGTGANTYVVVYEKPSQKPPSCSASSRSSSPDSPKQFCVLTLFPT